MIWRVLVLLVLSFNAYAEQTPIELITEARVLVNSDPKTAVVILNQILLLTPNEVSKEAQELISLAYIKINQPERAKAELKLYLDMYPDADKKIREQLIALEIANPQHQSEILRKPRQGQYSILSGNVSSYYYSGDQTLLISNLQLSGNYKDNQYSSRLAFRRTEVTNISKPESSRSNPSLGFVEFDDSFLGYTIIAGRQYPEFGAISRFDGVSTRYRISDEVRLAFVTGVPYVGAETANRHFYSIGVDFLPATTYDIRTYYTEQTADGYSERSAVGADLHYYDNGQSFTGSIEYDMLYRSLNSLTLHGSMDLNDYHYYFMVDRRKSPLLFANNALILGLYNSTQPYSSVGEAFRSVNPDDVYSFIKNSSSDSSSYVVGFSKKLNDKWDINLDLQMYNMSATNDPNFIPTIYRLTSLIAQPGVGDSYSVNAQLIGTDIQRRGHSMNVILVAMTDSVSNARSITIVDGRTYENFRLDTVGMYYSRTQPNNDSTTYMASLRGTWKLGKVSLESQLSLNKTITTESTLSKNVFVGIRYDF